MEFRCLTSTLAEELYVADVHFSKQAATSTGAQCTRNDGKYKKLSYRRETARQLPTWRGGARPYRPIPRRPLWLHLCVWSNPKPATNLRQACRPLSAL